MDSDDDFLPPTQFGQYRSSQAVTSTSRARDMLGPSRHGPRASQSGPRASQSEARASQSGPRASQSEARTSQSTQRASQPSQSQGSSQAELSQIQEGLKFLMERVQQISGDSRGIKRPAEQKPFDNKPDKERCHLCQKLYANKTTLFRHYRAIHMEMNPEKYHGCAVNSTVVNLDMSVENSCGVCGYVAANKNALDNHNRDVHSNDDVRPGSSAVNSNRTDLANKENVNIANFISRLHKCEECACYFEESNKLDDHLKVQHGYEVCKICNGNSLFKDIDGHVKDKHPDVYKKNNEIERVIVEKVMKYKNGDRVRVFICTKCDLKMVDKREAEKHGRGHKKGLKIKVAPRNKIKPKEIFNEVTSNDHVMLTCDNCNISTDSYEAAVEHSQNHVTNNVNDTLTQQCLICDLKFEPLCYKKHIDLHYKNKELNKESFQYIKYRFQELLSENGIKEPVLKEMMSRSIYKHTRSVKMRVVLEGAYTLYRCCQCDNFVEPTAVLNHTLNYDTCVKVKNSYTCEVCKRKFFNRLARDSHAKDHKSEESYKTVLFNHANDKEFNRILNDPHLRLNDVQNSEEVICTPKVLFKCLCGLCFVRKENADIHKKICPGKDSRKPCPKCNNLFNPDELVDHCFKDHLTETEIVIETFSPNVIVVDSDEESQNQTENNVDVIVIDSSDDEDAQTERFNNIKVEVLNTDVAPTARGSNEDTERWNLNAPEPAAPEGGNIEHVALEECLLIAKTENDNVDDDVNSYDNDNGVDNEMTDDSPDTIAYENTATVAARPAPDMNKRNQLKLVSPDLLINPLYFQNAPNENTMNMLNAEKTTSQEVETTNLLNKVNVTAIKQEHSWSDPTDFSCIRSRLSWKQRQMHPDSNCNQDIVESLLTDDEETETHEEELIALPSSSVNNELYNPIHLQNARNGNTNVFNAERTASIETVRQQVETTNSLNSTNVIHTVIKQEPSWYGPTDSNIRSINWLREINTQPAAVESLLTDDEETGTNQHEDAEINDSVGSNENNDNLNEENNDINGDSDNNMLNTTIIERTHNGSNDLEITVPNNDITPNIHDQANMSRAETESNEHDEEYSDTEDDLFIPSGIENPDKSSNTALNNNIYNMTKNSNSHEETNVEIDFVGNKTYCDSIVQSEMRKNIPVDNTVRVENTQDSTEINEFRSDENNDILQTNRTEIDRVTFTFSNDGTQDFAGIPQETTNITEREATAIVPYKTQQVNIKKEHGYMRKILKRIWQSQK